MFEWFSGFKKTSEIHKVKEDVKLEVVNNITKEEDIENTKKQISPEFMEISNNIGYIDKLRFNKAYGTDSHEIYLQCCKDLNFRSALSSEFGMKKICYAQRVFDDYSAWFLPYSNLAKIKKMPGGKWENYIRAPFIWETYDYGVVPMAKGDKRITFAKIYEDNKERYVFLGVYQSYQELKDKNGNLVLKYKRISKEYPE